MDAQVEEMKKAQSHKTNTKLNPTQEKIDISKYRKKKSSPEKWEKAYPASSPKNKQREGAKISLTNDDFYNLWVFLSLLNLVCPES